MSVSHANCPTGRFRSRWTGTACAAVLGLVLGAFGAPALAQTVGQGTGQIPGQIPGQTLGQTQGGLGKPTPLAPPTPLLPLDNSARTPEGLGPESDRPQIEGIEIAPLSEADPDSLGLLNKTQGGFGPELWRDSDATFVTALLPRLPDRYASATQWDLARRLLLSAAPAPRDEADTSATDAADQSGEPGLFLALRLDRLVALGDLTGLEQLIGRVPRRVDDTQERVARARVQSRMLSGAVEDGCREVSTGAHHQTPYWRKALIACQTVEGQSAEAELGLAILREQGGTDDKVFYDFLAALAGAEVTLPGRFAAQPLNAALLLFRGQPLPADSFDHADLGLAVALASSDQAGLELRARSGELAAAVGALPPANLQTIYASFPFTPGTGSGAGDLEAPATRASVFHQAAASAAQPNEAVALAGALAAVRDRNLWYRAMVAALSFRLTEIRPGPAKAQWAGALGRALYAAGRFEHAASWTGLARQSAASNPGAARSTVALWPYGRLIGAPSLAGSDGLAAWRQSRGDVEAERLAEWETLLRALFEALEGPESAPTAETPAPASTTPSANLAAVADLATSDAAPEEDGSGLLFDLRAASRAGRVGETLLLALVILGSEDLAMSDPETAAGVVGALKDIGLELEAQTLAIEIAIAKGV